MMCERMCLLYVSHLSKTIKDWITNNVRFSLTIAQIMAKYKQHCFEQNPTKEPWTHDYFVFPNACLK
jgi:hypothetical protein